MNRRDFMRVSAGGLGVAAGVLFAGNSVCAAEPANEREPIKSPDPEELAKAVHRHFIPGKRTCGESMMLGCCEVLQIDSLLVPDIALGLGGGIGVQGHTCGIVTGATMVIGLVVGSRETDYKKKKMRVFTVCGTFLQRFQKANHTVSCRKICGLDLTTAEGRKRLMGGIKAEKCGPLMLAGARILGQVLREDEERPSYIPPAALEP